MQSTPSAQEEVEKDIVVFFIKSAVALGFPKTIGQIFGCLFCSETPLAFEEIVEKLTISKGSVSTGLRTLLRVRAIKAIVSNSDRRTFYAAEISIRRLLGGLISNSLTPFLEESEADLDGIEKKLKSTKLTHLTERVTSLKAWHDQAASLIPLLTAYIQPGELDALLDKLPSNTSD